MPPTTMLERGAVVCGVVAADVFTLVSLFGVTLPTVRIKLFILGCVGLST